MSAKFEFQFTAGVLIRNKVKFEIEAYCARNDLTCNVIENKGILESDFQVVICGKNDDVITASEELTHWLDKISRR